jgi:hypothetical protein
MTHLVFTYCKRALLCVFFAAFALLSVGQEQPELEQNTQMGFNDNINRLADDFVDVYVVVSTPGDVLYSILGHAALYLVCDTFDLEYIYSYESESVQGKVLRFLLNDLKMGMTAIPMKDYLAPYIDEGRGVCGYKLNLPPEVEIELWRVLDTRLEEGMELQYDYIKRGCAISIVDNIQEAIRSANQQYGTTYQIDYAPWGSEFDRTLREIFYDNAPHGWGLFYCMTLVGGQVDNPKLPKEEKLICPNELVATWQQAKINNNALLSSDKITFLSAQKEYKTEPFTPLYASILLLLLSLLNLAWRRPYFDWLLLAIQTLIGVLMVWLLFSPLPGSEWSWLIIVFNPLPLVFWKWRQHWSMWYILIIVVWCMGMLLAPHRLVEYAHIFLALSFALVLFKQHRSNL